MKKTSLILASALAIVQSATAAEYHWNVTSGSGHWHDTSKWVDANGNAVDSYPGQNGTDDIAVFDGMNMAGRVYISVPVDLACLRFADGNSTFVHQPAQHFHADRLEISPHATFGYMADGWQAFECPADFTIGNRDEVLVNGGLIRGSMNFQNQASGNWSSRKALSISDGGSLLTGLGGDAEMNYNLWVDTSYAGLYGLRFGQWDQGDMRSICFNNAGNFTLTLPCGQIAPVNDFGGVGRPSENSQGTIDTLGEPLYFWPTYVESEAHTNYFRAKINAPKFLQCGSGCTILFDDHSNDTCDYDVLAGCLQLGGDLYVNNKDTVQAWTCTLGPGSLDIRWDGMVRVACDNALNRNASLCFHSFRDRGADRKVTDAVYGKLFLDGHDATVGFLYIDGNPTLSGTYGSSESNAEFKRDDLFTGTGVLTVRLSSLKGTKIFLQ